MTAPTPSPRDPTAAQSVPERQPDRAREADGTPVPDGGAPGADRLIPTPPNRRLSWAYGVTTVPARRRQELPAALASLKAAGFPAPRLFVDGEGSPSDEWATLGLPVSRRVPGVGAWGNWWLGLHELFIREPAADRYAMFQDDVKCVRGLRGYLDAVGWPAPRCYLNLYTANSNHETAFLPLLEAQGGDRIGFAAAGAAGRGAMGLVFDRAAVTALLGSASLASKPADARWPTFNIDGAVADAMAAAGFVEVVHHPSTMQLTDAPSTLPRNLPRQPSPSYPSEGTDALSWLQLTRFEVAEFRSAGSVQLGTRPNRRPGPAPAEAGRRVRG